MFESKGFTVTTFAFCPTAGAGVDSGAAVTKTVATNDVDDSAAAAVVFTTGAGDDATAEGTGGATL